MAIHGYYVIICQHALFPQLFSISIFRCLCNLTSSLIGLKCAEELVTGLSRVSWEKVDVSFHSSRQRFAAHSVIQVSTPPPPPTYTHTHKITRLQRLMNLCMHAGIYASLHLCLHFSVGFVALYFLLVTYIKAGIVSQIITGLSVSICKNRSSKIGKFSLICSSILYAFFVLSMWR